MDRESDYETRAIINVVLPFISRDKIRGTTQEDIQKHLSELISKIIIKVYGNEFDQS